MIRLATFRIQSSTLHGDQISAMLGIAPTDVSNLGERVSSRSPEGRKREFTTWCAQLAVDVDGLEDAMATLEGLASGVDLLRKDDENLSADLVLMVLAADMGFMVDFREEEVAYLASKRLGLMIDVYSDS